MYINITDNKAADNKGSCGPLVNYLEKENRTGAQETLERWFNHIDQSYEDYEVRRTIDSNIAKLGKDDAKFFLINISPSQKELTHLEEKYGADKISEMLKKYTVKVMDEYARNFNRNGIKSSHDLVWFAKLENNRYYTYNDKEVKNGTRRRGELKQGDQRHVQVIVSRKDLTNKIKLSPMNSSRGRNIEHSKKMGQFDRMTFKQCGETLFDREFGFERGLKDTIAYANIRKNGTLEQRIQLDTLEAGTALNEDPNNETLAIVHDISKEMFGSSAEMLETMGSTIGKFLDIMLEPIYDTEGSTIPNEPRRKKKKKGRYKDQSRQIGM